MKLKNSQLYQQNLVHVEQLVAVAEMTPLSMLAAAAAAAKISARVFKKYSCFFNSKIKRNEKK